MDMRKWALDVLKKINAVLVGAVLGIVLWAACWGCASFFGALGGEWDPITENQYTITCHPSPNDWGERHVGVAVWQHDRLEELGRDCDVFDGGTPLTEDEMESARGTRWYHIRDENGRQD